MFTDSLRKSFNGDWFFLAPAAAGHAVDAAVIPDGCQRVQLPHAWNATGWSYEAAPPAEPAGTGWYFKTLPAVKNAVLKFEGIAAAAEFFLNGRKLADHLGAHRVFELPLVQARGDGTDLLAIKVTDKPTVPLLPEAADPFSQSPRYKRWALPMGSSLAAGGIWRDVWLYRNDGPCMKTLVVESSTTALRVFPELAAATHDTRVRYELYDLAGRRVAQTEAAWNEAGELRPATVQLWWPLEPRLYRLEATLLQQGSAVQTMTQPVAFFEICRRNSEFYVNGRPYFLRGQNGFPHCNIPHDADYIRRYVSRLCEQGVEISRFHTEPPAHAWLDECDRQGILVIFEMALHGSVGCYALGHPQFQRTYMEELRSLVREYRRHPSIAMWCLGNEIIVDSERRLGLGRELFDVLEGWVDEVHRLDPRPVIANSGGDAAELVQKTVGDVDDIHQYGGWYTETLRDLRNYEKFICKHDFLFAPTICTESVAAYTGNDGRFFTRHNDVRQRKVVRQRLGDPDAVTAEQALQFQAFILKEYAEALWRMRRDDTTLGGYLPFGQYTWFFDPFDKGPDGLRDKPIWQTYRLILSPVHLQLECWDRHVVQGGLLRGNLLLNHEDRKLPLTAEFTLVVASSRRECHRRTVNVAYHSRFFEAVEFDVSDLPPGVHRLTLAAFCGGRCVAENERIITVYPETSFLTRTPVWIYDPVGRLEALVNEPEHRHRLPELAAMDFAAASGLLIIGPYAMDCQVERHRSQIRQWCENGNQCLVLEQLPDAYSCDMLQTGIGVRRGTQPYWSRWATNMVRHTDRADLNDPAHPVFAELAPADLAWWNGDSFLAHAYLRLGAAATPCRVLSGVGHGLADDELMPVAHSAEEQSYNPLLLECPCGRGVIWFSNLLIGTKFASEPVARKLLANLMAAGTRISR